MLQTICLGDWVIKVAEVVAYTYQKPIEIGFKPTVTVLLRNGMSFEGHVDVDTMNQLFLAISERIV